MTTVFANIMYKILVFFMSITAMFGTISAPSTDDPIKSADSENVRMTAVYWGDSQVSDYMHSRQQNVMAACLDVAGAQERIDALLIDGDIAENGKAAEYRLVLDDLALIDNVDNYIFSSGNHDVRLRLFSQTVKTFGEFCNMANPSIQLDKLYYSYEVNGYTFIILGTTSSTFEEADIDNEELVWFDNELQKAAVDGKPVFVLLHQPLKLTHNLPDSWNSPFDFAGSVGKQSDELKDIMNKYDNVFLLTGHLHSGLSEANFEIIDNFVSVNVPSIGIVSKDGGYEAAGTGYMIEVYDNSVLFRARDFAKGNYLPEFDREFTLK